MKYTCIASSLLVMAALVGCGGDEVSWETQEMQRSIAMENSTINAKAYRSKKGNKLAGYILDNQGDSSINKSCANGDGWSTVKLSSPKGQVVTLKCSTASKTIGCLEKSIFITKSYAEQDGSCNKDLPVPMPKLNK